MITKYKKQPVVIEALQYDGVLKDAILSFCGTNADIDLDGSLFINTLDGKMKVSPGDYVIKGVKGEFYPCKSDIFQETYDPVFDQDGYEKELTNNVSEKAEMKELNLIVYPSTRKTIFVEDDAVYGGAHKYRIISSLGFNNGEADYSVSHSQDIQFVMKDEEKGIIPGVQSEQLALVLLDRCKKLNNRFPSEQNEKMIKGLCMFLEACEERVSERMNRGVMGKLEK